MKQEVGKCFSSRNYDSESWREANLQVRISEVWLRCDKAELTDEGGESKMEELKILSL